MIRFDSESAAGEETACGGIDEWWLKEASLVVAFFGPGVGVIDVKRGEGIARALGADEMRGVGADHADVGDVPASEAVCGEPEEFVGPLDAEEVAVGMVLSTSEKEGGLTGSDFDFDGGGASEEFGPTEVFEASGVDRDDAIGGVFAGRGLSVHPMSGATIAHAMH